MNLRSGIWLLHRLARLYGVRTAYYDMAHCRKQASAEALLAVLRSLGAPVATLEDIPAAWRERQQEIWHRQLEPVAVAWDGNRPVLNVRLPSSKADALLAGHLTLETGEQGSWEWRGADLPVVKTAEINGVRYVAKRLSLPGKLPWGYHRFTLEMAGVLAETLLIAAPVKAYIPPERHDNRIWGVFLPLYGLHSGRSWGGGDFSDLNNLIRWTAEAGGNVVATLPFLAAFLDSPFEPSPYTPASRLLWNEFYLDITKIPELQKCTEARALLASSSFQDEVEALRHSPLVDYRCQMALKRQILEKLSQSLFDGASDRLEALHRFAEANPVVEDYARFRATGEKQRLSWPSWPQPLRDGVLSDGDYDEEARRYHLYVQWLAHEQVRALCKTAGERGLRLYLDLPLGVHPDGYDVWRQRSLFATDVSAGAPPDVVFTKGQDWAFPPLRPEKIREQGYRYVIAYLRHHLQHAGILRLDHVMGLHRLYWIPKSLEASEGVYVCYRAKEMYAILALESHRSQTIIVGEDLGTVPPYVRPAMARHGLHRMYVVHYELASTPQAALRLIPPDSVASLNTHDMPPFAAFWQGLDIQERLELGLLDEAGARNERITRQVIREALVAFLRDRGWIKEAVPDTQAVVKACLAFLGASQSRIVLVNLEDLWLETKPQNIPAIKEEYPNWRRKARYSFETFCQMPQVVDTLRLINQLRKQEPAPTI